MVKKIAILLIVAHFSILPVQARDYNPLSKLARGAVNTGLCWVEIPRQMVKVQEADGNEISGDIAGIFWGPLKCVCYTFGRAVVGGYELATFLIPTYKPLVRPEYIFYDGQEED